MRFWLKLQNLWPNFNFNFLLHNFSKYVNCEEKFGILTRKALGDMARTRLPLRRTWDERTDIHKANTYICLPHDETYNSPSHSYLLSKFEGIYIYIYIYNQYIFNIHESFNVSFKVDICFN